MCKKIHYIKFWTYRIGSDASSQGGKVSFDLSDDSLAEVQTSFLIDLVTWVMETSINAISASLIQTGEISLELSCINLRDEITICMEKAVKAVRGVYYHPDWKILKPSIKMTSGWVPRRIETP